MLAVAYLKQLLLFLLLFASLGAVHRLVGAFFGTTQREAASGKEVRVGKYLRRPYIYRWRELLQIIALTAAVLATILWIALFRLANPPEVFYLILAAVVLASSAVRLKSVGKPILGIVSGMLGSTAAAYLSIQLSTGSWLWQPAVIALAFGATVAAPQAAELILAESGALPQRRRVLARLCPAFVVLGPVLFGVLVTLGQVGNLYLFSFAVLPLMAKHLGELKAYEESGVVPARLPELVSTAAILFIAIVFGVSIQYT